MHMKTLNAKAFFVALTAENPSEQKIILFFSLLTHKALT